MGTNTNHQPCANYVLWGLNPKFRHPYRLKLEVGTLRECQTEMKRRDGEGWEELGIC